LVKGEWWLPPTKMTTDGEGEGAVHGYFGGDEVTCDGATATFSLENKGIP
jgi:hypothetical protein